MIFNAPEGLFGNPNAITHCTSSDFALDQCPSNSQAGLITSTPTTKANRTICSAPPRSTISIPRAEQTAALRLHRADPRTSRSTSRSRCAPASDYGLRFTVQDITPARLRWPAPSSPSGASRRTPPTTPNASPKAPGNPPNCAGLDRYQLPGQAGRAERSRTAADRQPDDLHRDRSPPASKCRPTRTPKTLPQRNRQLSRRRPAVTRRSSTRCSTRARHRRNRLALGPQHRAERPAVPGSRRLAVGAQIGDRHPARRLHDQPRRRRRPDRVHRRTGQLRLRGPGRMPRQRQDRNLHDRHPGASRPARRLRLHRRTEAGRPVPPLPDRLGLRHQRQAGRLVQARTRKPAS